METIKKIMIGVLALIIITLTALFYGIKVSPISWGLLGPINESSTLALKGYDTVAYFSEGKIVKGDTTKGIKWRDVIWYFSTDTTKLMFKTFPEMYVPQYGGYCATAVAYGFTADSNPEIWHIENNKLYLFLNQDAKNEFVSEIKNGIIEKAANEWARR
jgi:hypothetical protein